MDYTKEFRKMLDYRQRLIENAKPGWGFMPWMSELNELDFFKETLEDPDKMSEREDYEKAIIFDYLIAIPLMMAEKCRTDFNAPRLGNKLNNKLLEDVTALFQDGAFTEEEMEYLPDLLNESLNGNTSDLTKDERDWINPQKRVMKKAIKVALSKDESMEDVISLFSDLADFGRSHAIHCFVHHANGLYRSFEWEVFEGIFRSPYFPTFFEECEKEAGTPEIQYKYKKWPHREFFLRNDVWGQEVTNYITDLHPDILKSFETEEGYRNFKSFMQQLAIYGEINNDANMEALIQLITGYHFEGASRRVKWSGEPERVRILFFVIKYISTVNKGRFQILQKGNSTVDFVGINTDSGEYENLVDKYNSNCDPSRYLAKARGISDDVLNSLHSYYDFFPENREQA